LKTTKKVAQKFLNHYPETIIQSTPKKQDGVPKQRPRSCYAVLNLTKVSQLRPLPPIKKSDSMPCILEEDSPDEIN
ncbi:MAG: hypothetical protein OXE99_02695, partial [Cellvibrionales bacterium]|nr:hypothetical protein [Cellvibrionales bacterium]